MGLSCFAFLCENHFQRVSNNDLSTNSRAGWGPNQTLLRRLHAILFSNSGVVFGCCFGKGVWIAFVSIVPSCGHHLRDLEVIFNNLGSNLGMKWGSNWKLLTHFRAILFSHSRFFRKRFWKGI